MKTIGLIGGSTYVSTTEYYKTINQLTQKKLGGSCSAAILMYSMKFQEFKEWVQTGTFEEVAKYLSNIAVNLEKGGAECLVICANTPHMYVDVIQQSIKMPIIHIADATAREIKNKGLKKVALLGTKPTMEQDFYKKKLAEYGIETIIPNDADREYINETIFNEFGREIFTAEAKQKYLSIIQQLKEQGAEGVILGCTEIPILIKQEDCNIPVFDTMFIHANAAVNFANE